MQRVIATTRDAIEDLASWANEYAESRGGEVVSIQVLPMADWELDKAFFAAVALVDVPEDARTGDPEMDRARALAERAMREW